MIWTYCTYWAPYQIDIYNPIVVLGPTQGVKSWFHWVTSGTKTCPNPTHRHPYIYQFFFKIQMLNLWSQWSHNPMAPSLLFLSFVMGLIMESCFSPHPQRSVIYVTYISWVLHVGLWVFVLNLFLINCSNFKIYFS